MDLAYAITLALILLPMLGYALYLLIYPKKRIYEKQTKETAMKVSVILTCYNEERYLEAKILQLIRECEQPLIAAYEIIIVSDGSTDLSNKIANKLVEKFPFLNAIYLKNRTGKPNALNLGVTQSKYPIIVLCDARQVIGEGSLTKMLQHFSDENVGAVTCKLATKSNPSNIRNAINRLKQWESNSGSTVSIYGPLYAMQKSCYRKIPTLTILDDMFVSLSVLQQGKTIKVEPEAVVYDVPFEQLYTENRTLRIVGGLFQLLKQNFKLILRLPLRYQVYILGQKYWKLFLPLLLVISIGTAYLCQSELPWNVSIFLMIGIVFGLIVCKGFHQLFNLAVVCLRNLRRMQRFKNVLWDKTPF